MFVVLNCRNGNQCKMEWMSMLLVFVFMSIECAWLELGNDGVMQSENHSYSFTPTPDVCFNVCLRTSKIFKFGVVMNLYNCIF